MFNFSFDKRMLYVILVIMIIFGLQSLISNPAKLWELVLTVPGVIIALTFHEFAHAYIADKLGDDTPRMQGRLNLNPLTHMDPIGTILLLTAGFGWGKPVEINPRNFNRDMSLSKAEALVAFAGPAMNFILAFIFLIISYVFVTFNIIKNMEISIIVNMILILTVMTNIGLGIFNLIPLPPLDGSKILMHFLPYNGKRWFESKQMIFYIIFIVIWIAGLAPVIIQPVFNLVYMGMDAVVGGIFGLFG